MTSLAEFDKFYSDSFLRGGEREGETSASAGVGQRLGTIAPQNLESLAVRDIKKPLPN